MIEILLFAVLGIIIGIIFGLIPGLHPNLIVFLIPVILQFNLDPLPLISFVVAIGASNIFLDFIPSMLLGAPDAGKELSVLPAHRMLMNGNGYDAVKLAVTGGIWSLVLLVILLPVIFFTIPQIYTITKPFTYAFLIFIVFVLVMSEKGNKKFISLACFILAGVIGIFSSSLPINRTLLLFPILSGLFGVSTLLFASTTRTKIPKRKNEILVSGRQTRRSVLFGSLGGIFSGILPGVGSSEIASLANIDKNEKSFLMTLGAITITNTVMSIISLWLIQKSRSGIAVVLEQLTNIGFNETLLIISVFLFSAGAAAIITLKAANVFLSFIEKINYTLISKAVIVFIIFMTVLFTGLYGLLLLITCTALGIFVSISNIRRSILMGVLILPTILFYLPF